MSLQEFLRQARILWKVVRPMAIVVARYTGTDIDDKIIVVIDNLLKED